MLPEDVERLAGALVAQSPVRAAQLGNLLVRGRRVERALPIFERLTKLHPNSATQWKSLAAAYRAVGRRADAANAIRAAYALDPFDEGVAEAYKQAQQDE
jgi:Flp pilus assembly protein TadD